MKKYVEDYLITSLTTPDNKRMVVFGVGFATFFFGFATGAVLNLYLLWIQSPLVLQLRASLTYKSAIFGDGILLPVINMVIMVFLLRNWGLISRRLTQAALFFGTCITIYFHVTQAMQGIVNWAMPSPWHWNILGVWHAVYMFSVASLLSLFYLVVLKKVQKERRIKHITQEIVIVSSGLLLFFMLLRFDYIAIDLRNLIPGL